MLNLNNGVTWQVNAITRNRNTAQTIAQQVARYTVGNVLLYKGIKAKYYIICFNNGLQLVCNVGLWGYLCKHCNNIAQWANKPVNVAPYGFIRVL